MVANETIEGLGDLEKKVQKIGEQAWYAAIRAAEEGCRFQKELFPFRSNLVRTKVDKKGENKPRSLEQLMNVKQVIIGLAKSMRAPGHPLREFTFTALCIVIGPIMIAIAPLVLMAWMEYCATDAFALNGTPGPLTNFDGWKRLQN